MFHLEKRGYASPGLPVSAGTGATTSRVSLKLPGLQKIAGLFLENMEYKITFNIKILNKRAPSHSLACPDCRSPIPDVGGGDSPVYRCQVKERSVDL